MMCPSRQCVSAGTPQARAMGSPRLFSGVLEASSPARPNRTTLNEAFAS